MEEKRSSTSSFKLVIYRFFKVIFILAFFLSVVGAAFGGFYTGKENSSVYYLYCENGNSYTTKELIDVNYDYLKRIGWQICNETDWLLNTAPRPDFTTETKYSIKTAIGYSLLFVTLTLLSYYVVYKVLLYILKGAPIFSQDPILKKLKRKAR